MTKLVKLGSALLVVGAVLGMTTQAALAKGKVTHVKLVTFQKVEVVPNTTLDNPETVTASSGTLVRQANGITGIIATTGLPEGVYTFWWHLTHPDGEVSILWAGNAMVTSNGVVQLLAVLPEGEENAPGYIFIGHSLQPDTAATVDVQLWVRTHGAASANPVVLERQLTRPFGRCTDTRNMFPMSDGPDYPCWNPQRAIFF